MSLVAEDLTAFALKGSGGKITKVIDEYIDYYRTNKGRLPDSITLSREQMRQLKESLNGWEQRVYLKTHRHQDVPDPEGCTYHGIPLKVAG